jgi:hypothetical protein
MSKIIARHQEGITLNPYEFICDMEGNTVLFENDDKAVEYLNNNSDKPLTKDEWDLPIFYIVEYSDYFI